MSEKSAARQSARHFCGGFTVFNLINNVSMSSVFRAARLVLPPNVVCAWRGILQPPKAFYGFNMLNRICL